MAIMEKAAREYLESALPASAKGLHEVNLNQARESLRQMQMAAKGLPAVPEVAAVTVAVPVGSEEIQMRIVRPQGITTPLPVMLYLHGGGWVRGDVDTHDRLMRSLAIGSGCAVAFVSYSRAPEAKYPRAVKEAFASLMWLVENGASNELDGSRIAVVGEEAGANLAAAVTLLAKQRGGPAIRLQVLVCPITDAGFDTPSYKEHTAGPVASAAAMKWCWSQYAPDAPTRTQLMVSPLRATTEQLAGLPPAVVITAENDVLRDEGEAYARKLMEAGVPVAASRYAGAVHDFFMLCGLSTTGTARGAVSQVCAAVREALRE
jgi:acetyl esterase